MLKEMIKEMILDGWVFVQPFLAAMWSDYYMETATVVCILTCVIVGIGHRAESCCDMDFEEAFYFLFAGLMAGAAWPVVLGLGAIGLVIALLCGIYMGIVNFGWSILGNAVKAAKGRWKAGAEKRAERRKNIVKGVLSLKGRFRIKAIRAVKGKEHIPLSKPDIERVIDV